MIFLCDPPYPPTDLFINFNLYVEFQVISCSRVKNLWSREMYMILL